MSFSANVDVSGSLDAGVDIAGVAGLAGIADSNAKIIPILPPGIPVVFSYNPEKMTAKQKNTSQKNAVQGNQRPRLSGTSPTTLNFKAQIEGPQARPMAEQLLKLTGPSEELSLLGMLAGLLGIKLAVELPVVMFMWGTYVIPECNVTTCSVSYERFHISGVPLRAICTVTLTEVDSILPFTNPSSGGFPGREQHVVVSGESLPQLATRSYGRPAHWRDVAVANNIDDPFALRPGDNLFLPALSELEGRGRA